MAARPVLSVTEVSRRSGFAASALRFYEERELATLPTGRTPTRADWQRLSGHWRSRLDEQIAALEQLRDGLDSCIGCGCLSLSRCRISNPDDAAGGVGARFLPRALRARPGGR